jgi:hypothetical protein
MSALSLKADIHRDDGDVSFVGSSVGLSAAGNDGQVAGACRTSLSCFQRLMMYFAMITRPTQMTAIAIKTTKPVMLPIVQSAYCTA